MPKEHISVRLVIIIFTAAVLILAGGILFNMMLQNKLSEEEKNMYSSYEFPSEGLLLSLQVDCHMALEDVAEENYDSTENTRLYHTEDHYCLSLFSDGRMVLFFPVSQSSLLNHGVPERIERTLTPEEMAGIKQAIEDSEVKYLLHLQNSVTRRTRYDSFSSLEYKSYASPLYDNGYSEESLYIREKDGIISISQNAAQKNKKLQELLDRMKAIPTSEEKAKLSALRSSYYSRKQYFQSDYPDEYPYDEP